MRAAGAARQAIEVWALLGGLVLAALVLVNVWTVLGGLLGLPFAGDVELTEMGVAVAAFMFLPYCQVSRQNVTADIFTARLGDSGRRALDGIASFVALSFAALLLWRMFLGFLDQRAYGYSSTILQIPVWWAYVPILVSLGLLVLAALLTLSEDLAGDA
ncbi:TRAP transporter small permease [Halovulum dunhuangense]|uniref:TRAP transporter small permease protein n=1 Tax=Halovulum dunhuangense TaxID=1505036 RepID=A0A849L1J8_9RHOB|nr:TRAP transporter small permease [Halovulum dunhuangense]NNU80140.1 TRAP transporter small permease [Halovulum dunhuangense]